MGDSDVMHPLVFTYGVSNNHVFTKGNVVDPLGVYWGATYLQRLPPTPSGIGYSATSGREHKKARSENRDDPHTNPMNGVNKKS